MKLLKLRNGKFVNMDLVFTIEEGENNSVSLSDFDPYESVDYYGEDAKTILDFCEREAAKNSIESDQKIKGE